MLARSLSCTATLSLCLAISASSLATAAPATSDKDVAALLKAVKEQSARLATQEKKLADQEKALEEQKRVFIKEKNNFQRLQSQVAAVTGIPASPSATDEKITDKESKTVVRDSATPAQAAQGGTSASPREVGVERKQSQEKPPEIAAIIEEGGVLLQRGKMVITPAVEYTHSSATRVEINGFSIVPALNIGLFDISQVNRDMITPSLGVRYGLTNRFEIETKIPYVYRHDSTLSRPVGVPNAPNTLNSVNGANIGDVELGAHYQINKGENNWPYFVGNLRFKTATGTSPFEVPVVNGLETELPTGSGFYAVQPSVTAIFPTDPVVYYSNLGYLHSFKKSFANYGEIEPGDGFSASLGMSITLNDKSSFSVGYGHTTVLKTLVNGQALANSDILQVGALDFGYSYNLNDKTNLNFTVSAGVTQDAPDVRLVFRVPMAFDLLGK